MVHNIETEGMQSHLVLFTEVVHIPQAKEFLSKALLPDSSTHNSLHPLTTLTDSAMVQSINFNSKGITELWELVRQQLVKVLIQDLSCLFHKDMV